MVYKIMEAIRLRHAARESNKVLETERELGTETIAHDRGNRRLLLDCEMLPARTALIGEDRGHSRRITAYCGLDYSSAGNVA